METDNLYALRNALEVRCKGNVEHFQVVPLFHSSCYVELYFGAVVGIILEQEEIDIDPYDVAEKYD